MAITTTTIGINTANVGVWSGTDVINQLDDAFKWLGFHGESETGLVIGISSIIGSIGLGGTITSPSEIYQDVRPVSTTGIGTGASFYVERRAGNDDENIFSIAGRVYRIYVNRPGVGYTGGEIVTISAEDIGGSANGATDLGLQLVVAGTVDNAVSYAVTFTGGYESSGTDRNGQVSGAATTITIREGDTLLLTNNNTSPASRTLNIVWNTPTGTNIGAGNSTSVFNSTQLVSTSGGVLTWTPQPGQAGTYFVRPYAIFYTSFNSETPKIIVEPAISGSISTVSYGGTTGFYAKESDGVEPDPYGVLKHTIQSGKTYGTTYRGFGIYNTEVPLINYWAGSGFFPAQYNVTNNNYSGSHALPQRFVGSQYLDTINSIAFSNSSLEFMVSSRNDAINRESRLTPGTNYNYQLDLNIFRSGLDPNFAVLSFRNPAVSSTTLSGNTFSTFFLHNFTTNIWDLDDLFLSGYTEIIPNGGNSNIPYLLFRTWIGGMGSYYTNGGITNAAKRSAEFGYGSVDNNGHFQSYTAQFYYSNTLQRNSTYLSPQIYYRPSSLGYRNSGGSSNLSGNDRVSTDANFNAVIKGIPLNPNLVPCPYYLPDDFVLIDFDYATPSANIQQGDTITISGSEVYTIITASYNQTTRTRGILFCARTV
jgi:hypothetical protein